PNLLEELIFSDFIHEENYAGIGIQLYEQLGDLQGSALLQSEKIIKRTVQIVCENAIKENIKYLEIRCSPLNYTRGNLNGLDVYKIICDTLEEYKDQLRTKLLIIASRHSELSKIQAHMDLISEIFESGDPYLSYLAGVDLAGNENAMEPEKLREPFLSAMEKNIHITIHAGETADVNNIWQAIYHLNAERIGHGLTLKNDKSLMKKILDRKIGIEMCPSSNTQIVGFRDFYKNKSDHFEEYPLKEYLDNKLKVTINTDNTGISRTSISKEFLKACHLTENGLSVPEILQIIKNSIDSSFLSYDEKLKLTNEIETEIIEFLRRDILCQNSSWLARVKS
ncbi:MAG: hypothetical protein D6732_10040, partial [Methanobacteriota archaeon]